MSNITSDSNIVEVSVPRVHNLHHVELLTPKPNESLDFFTRVLGLHETHREGQSVYLRGSGEWGQYSTILTESPTAGLGHMGWQVAEPEHVQGWGRRLKDAGVEHRFEAGGSSFAQGDTVSFEGPYGHKMELFYDFERFVPEDRSKLLSQPVKFPTPGIGARRLDHLNITAKDVDDARNWYSDVLGFKLREALRTPDGDLGAWMSVSSQVHDMAIMRDGMGEEGRLHHIAYWLETPETLLRAVDTFVEEGTPIDVGPGKHGLTQAFYVYVFEPGGNRVELFTGGYPIYGPDWDPVIWEGENMDRAIVWYGGQLPDTFFNQAT
uniref:Metapyrocatechase n=1 Tax=Rhodococcus rhodochrous TaxID=1829 RepID=Q59770_RHORH|nr:catechol 2,3-dioxygenase [Rhodococcus rhodochrous]